MKVFVNGEESNAKCILYESMNGLLEIRKDQNYVLAVSKTGSKAIESHDVIELEERGNSVTLIVNGKRIGGLRDARKQQYDFS